MVIVSYNPQLSEARMRTRVVDPNPRPRPHGLPDKYLVDREAAELLDVCVGTLRRWRDEGKAPQRVGWGSAGMVWERSVIEAWERQRLEIKGVPHTKHTASNSVDLGGDPEVALGPINHL